jgi:hypothetical protein
MLANKRKSCGNNITEQSTTRLINLEPGIATRPSKHERLEPAQKPSKQRGNALVGAGGEKHVTHDDDQRNERPLIGEESSRFRCKDKDNNYPCWTAAALCLSFMPTRPLTIVG